MTPLEEIRAAAAKLEQRVEALDDCRGPWYIVNEQARPYPQNISNIGVPYCVATTTTDPSHEPTLAQYICTMNPRVGAALLQLLQQGAEALEGHTIADDEPLLVAARAINYQHVTAGGQR
ncbi:hypothetical protein [Streptomyces cylindrosporus]|uniref:Uncharacterized protein n=1 Tax=Streptomyces cylindrosporus TaxID=2927583 RepID=A0ABS9YK08_9ACTN|nr:hypothetical protein [Streptomyces cylindrosporus]MCI3277587.1 hypothetical protein [Streptomyces cylindrosporus]